MLARSYKQGRGRGYGCLDRLGRVDHTRVLRDGRSLGDVVKGAAQWTRRVRTEGASWSALPEPSVAELWPNMNAGDGAPWSAAKRQIAEELEDLTLVWNVGPKGRGQAHACGVTRWSDPRASAAVLGVTGGAGATVDAVLEANRAGSGPVVRPESIRGDGGGWKEPAAVELFVDFETVNDLADDFSSIPKRGGQALIFQIGCVRKGKKGWEVEQFTARDLSVEAELEMLGEWLDYLRERATAGGVGLSDVRLFHWSPAETTGWETAFNSACKRHPSLKPPKLGWYDLLGRVIKAEPVTVKGAFGFGVKAVAGAMQEGGLIETPWESGPADGLGAMVGAWRAAERARAEGCAFRDTEEIKLISEYNEVDCRVMAEMVEYLRRDH